MDRTNITQQLENQECSESVQNTHIRHQSTEPASGDNSGIGGQNNENADKPKKNFKYEDFSCVLLITAVSVLGFFVALESFRIGNYEQGVIYLCFFALMSLLPWNLIRGIPFKRIAFFVMAALHLLIVFYYMIQNFLFEDDIILMVCGLTAVCYFIFYRHYIVKPLKELKKE